MTEIRLDVIGYGDSDERERAGLTRQLERVLLQSDVEDVSRSVGTAPAGAKGTAIEWAQLVVTMAGPLPPLLTAIRGWLRRSPGSSVSLEIDGDKLTLTEPSGPERDELIRAWTERHGG